MTTADDDQTKITTEQEDIDAAFSGGFESDDEEPHHVDRRDQEDEAPTLGDEGDIDELGDRSEEEDAAALEAGKNPPPPDDEPSEAERLRAENETLQKRMRKVEGKFGELNKQFLALTKAGTAAADETRDAGGKAPSKDRIRDALKSSEKMQALKEDFPEYGEALDEQMSVIAENLPDLEAFQAEIAKQVQQARLDDISDRIEEVHEGWWDTVNAPEFVTWLEAQDEATQKLYESDRPRDVIKMLNEHSKFKAWTEDQPAEVRALGTDALLARYSKDGALSGQQPGSRTTQNRSQADRQRLEAAVPATTRGGGSRREPQEDPREIFRKAVAGES